MAESRERAQDDQRIRQLRPSRELRDSPAEQEEKVRKQYEDLLSIFAADVPEAAFRPVIDELVSKVLASMSPPPDDSPAAGMAAQPDSASTAEVGNDADHPSAA